MKFLKKLFDEKFVGETGAEEDVKAELVKEDAESEDSVMKAEEAENKEAISDIEKPVGEYSLMEISGLCGESDVSTFVSDILSEEFSVFADGRDGTLSEKHDAFVKFKALMKNGDVMETVTEENFGNTREHSGFSGTSFKDYSSGLTARQMKIARDAGMSYREYSELLEGVPSKKRNKNLI